MSAYQLNKLCHRLHHDRSFREALQADPGKALAGWPLSDAERAAFVEAIRPVFDKMDKETGAEGKRIRAILEPYWQ